MSQTREKWNSIVWVELTFKGCEDAMIFCVLIFIFCLEPKMREQLDENDFRHYYGIFSESAILKLLDHSYVQSYFATVRRLFCNRIWNNSLQLKILRTWISIGTTYFYWNKNRRKGLKNHLHNNPSLLFKEYCTKKFHLLLYASFSLSKKPSF